ncbi:MAG: N-(5'-phosphoribosyl)anthranilate isomerase [Flammeovirgaceae bacterium]|nr:N-(5'-phosphoribosyl)anthranilate isomerase [Flammeovirgaceae bacterium]|tara:strand:- start:328 stop:936 length:609 start_codon:yes stop_codon:yes gene_type:complete
MKLKVCGMREVTNIKSVLALKPDLMGFIFYPQSKRFVEALSLEGIDFRSTQKVGVFVNEPLDSVIEKIKTFGLDYVQLHGDEPPSYLANLKYLGVKVIKVFRIKDQLPIDQMSAFEQEADYFLYDTLSHEYGGSGKRFKWNILNESPSSKPFWLSGGLSLESLKMLNSINHRGFIGIDVNSKFEDYPGMKNIELLGALKKSL